MPALPEPALHQRPHDVAQQPCLAGELHVSPVAQHLAEEHVWVVVVAGEQLVARLAVEHDLHLASCKAHHHPHREWRARHHGLFHVPHPRLELAYEVLVGGFNDATVGAGFVENSLDVRALVDRVAREERRERLEMVTE